MIRAHLHGSAIVLHPTTFWAAATEGLCTSYAGGWALDPAQCPVGGPPRQTLWGIPVFRCADLPTATGLVGNFAAMDLYLGNEFRIDVSSEAGTRFDQNIAPRTLTGSLLDQIARRGPASPLCRASSAS